MSINNLKEQLLAAVDSAIENGYWDSSLFLKNMLKQLQELRAYISKELTGNIPATKEEEIKQRIVNILREKEGYKTVYIALYQTENDRLDRWLLTIKLLSEYGISRPVYGSEAEMHNMLREKHGKGDAYVSVWVKETDILPTKGEGSLLKDRWGQVLLQLKDGFFRLENVIEFVLNGRRYHVLENSLILVDA